MTSKTLISVLVVLLMVPALVPTAVAAAPSGSKTICRSTAGVSVSGCVAVSLTIAEQRCSEESTGAWVCNVTWLMDGSTFGLVVCGRAYSGFMSHLGRCTAQGVAPWFGKTEEEFYRVPAGGGPGFFKETLTVCVKTNVPVVNDEVCGSVDVNFKVVHGGGVVALSDSTTPLGEVQSIAAEMVAWYTYSPADAVAHATEGATAIAQDPEGHVPVSVEIIP